MKRMLLLLTAASSIFLMPQLASACTDSMCLAGGIEVQTTFVVSVTYNESPLAGVSVQIRSNAQENPKVWFSGKTDKSGLVAVENLRPGEYWISTEFLGVSAGQHCFQVRSRAKKPKSRLDFEWGEWAISTRAVAGSLTVYRPGSGTNLMQRLIHQTRESGAAISMSLIDIENNETYQATTSSDGSFAFPGIPEGTYVLHIGDSGTAQQNALDESYEVIELSSSGNRSYLAFAARPTNCPGLYFRLE